MKKRESKYWKLIIKVVGEQIYKWKKVILWKSVQKT